MMMELQTLYTRIQGENGGHTGASKGYPNKMIYGGNKIYFTGPGGNLHHNEINPIW